MFLQEVRTYEFTKTSNKDEECINVLPHRQVILFAAACARSVLHVWQNFDKRQNVDKKPEQAILMAEKVALLDVVDDAAVILVDAYAYADDDVDARAARAAGSAAWAACSATWPDWAARAVWHAAHADAKWKEITTIFRWTLESPLPFPIESTNRNTVSLAEIIVRNREWSLMSVLADALEDSGFRDYKILDHLRQDKEFALSEWVLWKLYIEGLGS